MQYLVQIETESAQSREKINILIYSGLIFTTHWKLHLHSWDLKPIIIPDYTHLKLNSLALITDGNYAQVICCMT